ncbi:MAG: class I SAM-dependent methyltransferase [Chloroflexota bacterium]
MGYYDEVKNVENYIKMAEGYDGATLISKLQDYLPAGSSVLELGMGPGKDLALLQEHYRVTGSDSSTLFVERYRQIDPQADVVTLDAVTMDIDRQFDAIYSNKVLYHLTKADFKQSLMAQAQVLNEKGILFHALWYGDEEADYHGVHSVYYTEETLQDAIGDSYEILEFTRYTEMEEDDSFYVVLRRT